MAINVRIPIPLRTLPGGTSSLPAKVRRFAAGSGFAR